MSRPNILLLVSDQHQRRIMGCAGDAVVATPRLDGLAEKGVRFDACYCPAPVCLPSRMCMLSGKYPRDLGVWTNRDQMGEDVPTFAHSLALAGYRTILCGRNHMHPQRHRGFSDRLVGEVTDIDVRPVRGLFEGVLSPQDTGQTGVTLRTVGAGSTTYLAYDRQVTDRACRVLTELARAADQRPWCMMVGWVSPHNPWVAPPEFYAPYDGKVELPPTWQLDPAAHHPAFRKLRADRGVDEVPADQQRRARGAYYGLVSFLDHCIGRVLDGLAASGGADRTVVVYLSDHGEMAGEQRMWWKETLFDGAATVPMIWSWPGNFAQGAAATAVCNLIDVGPTLLAIGDAEALPGSRGANLLPLLRSGGTPRGWPDQTLSEAWPAGQRPGALIRRGKWKLCLYRGFDQPQLFNIGDDPYETTDLADDPAHGAVRDDLIARLCREWDGERVEQRRTAPPPAGDLVARWRAQIGVQTDETFAAPVGANWLVSANSNARG